jgi:microcystin-dependent protein
MSDGPYTGEICIYGGDYAPNGWAKCDGQILNINDYWSLFALLGNRFGGDGATTFGLPDLRGRVVTHNSSSNFGRGGEENHVLTAGELPAHAHQAQASAAAGSAASPAGNLWADAGKHVYAGASSVQMSAAAVSSQGASQGHGNMPPFLTLNFCIALDGIYPSSDGFDDAVQFVGEMRIFPYTFAPSGWLFCNGQTLQVSQYSALYSLIGASYGGGGSSFMLPNLQLRAALGAGQGTGLTNQNLGTTGGSQTVTLSTNQMPAHSHALMAASGAGDSHDPTGRTWASATVGRQAVKLYGPNGGANMSTGAFPSAGSGQAHNNMPPYQELHYAIATSGMFPSFS